MSYYKYIDKSAYSEYIIPVGDLLRHIKHYVAELVTISPYVPEYKKHFITTIDEEEGITYIDAALLIDEFKCDTNSKKIRLMFMESLKKFATCNGFDVAIEEGSQYISMFHYDLEGNQDFVLRIMLFAYDDGGNARINTKINKTKFHDESYEWKLDDMDINALIHYFETITKNKWWEEFNKDFIFNRNRYRENKTVWETLKITIKNLFQSKNL